MDQILKNRIKENLFSPLGFFGIILFLTIVISTAIFSSAFSDLSVRTNVDGITVSGTSQRYVSSDRGSISIYLSIDNSNLGDVNSIRKITEARNVIGKYLVNNESIDPKDVDILPMNIIAMCTERDKNYYDNCLGKKYNSYSMIINVSSDDVAKIKDLSLNLNNKINMYKDIAAYFDNVSLTVNNTQYLYTKFDSVKSEMLNEATKNAFERAQSIAKSTGNKAGEVITASQGVFQITAKDSTDTSDYGSYDTSTIDKKITAVVRVSFKVK